MTKSTRLEHKIARLAEPDASVQKDGRLLTATDLRGRLLVLLQEIDETILPSKLVFSTAAQDKLVLEVAHRRLLRLNGTALPQTAEGEVLLSVPAGRIQGFVSGTEILKVKGSRLSRQVDPSEVGCSSTAIAKFYGIDLYRTAPESEEIRLDSFMEACSPLSSAWMRIDASGIIQKSGTIEDTQLLAAILESDLAELDRNLAQFTSEPIGPYCTIFGTSCRDKRSIAYLNAGTSVALVLFVSKKSSQVHSLWRSIHQ